MTITWQSLHRTDPERDSIQTKSCFEYKGVSGLDTWKEQFETEKYYEQRELYAMPSQNQCCNVNTAARKILFSNLFYRVFESANSPSWRTDPQDLAVEKVNLQDVVADHWLKTPNIYIRDA